MFTRRMVRSAWRPAPTAQAQRAIHWSFGQQPPHREVHAPEGNGPVVSIVYGSFDKGYSQHDANKMYKQWQSGSYGLRVLPPQSGAEFEFDSLKDTDVLVVCCSSQTGFPCDNFAEFAHQLMLVSETGEEGCLSHLQHAVWGNGDPRWIESYMNVPRFIDLLLEDCGSRRFYARGEMDEPHAPTSTECCQADTWGLGMWGAATALADADAPGARADAVPWDAQWASASSPFHHRVSPFELEVLVRRNGELQGAPSLFARPDDVYHEMIQRVRNEVREREEEQARRRAARKAAAAARMAKKKD